MTNQPNQNKPSLGSCIRSLRDRIDHSPSCNSQYEFRKCTCGLDELMDQIGQYIQEYQTLKEAEQKKWINRAVDVAYKSQDRIDSTAYLYGSLKKGATKHVLKHWENIGPGLWYDPISGKCYDEKLDPLNNMLTQAVADRVANMEDQAIMHGIVADFPDVRDEVKDNGYEVLMDRLRKLLPNCPTHSYHLRHAEIVSSRGMNQISDTEKEPRKEWEYQVTMTIQTTDHAIPSRISVSNTHPWRVPPGVPWYDGDSEDDDDESDWDYDDTWDGSDDED